MIRETISRKNHPALTSDHWHVVRARLAGDPDGAPRFVRSIVSEHDDRVAAVTAARRIVRSVATEMAELPRAARDQVFVRKPDFKSLKVAKRVKKRRK